MYNFIQIAPSTAEKTKKTTTKKVTKKATSKKSSKNGGSGRLFLRLDNGGPNLQKVLSDAPAWQLESLIKSDKEVVHFQSDMGPVWILRPRLKDFGFYGAFEENLYAWVRDTIGTLWTGMKSLPIPEIVMDLGGASEDILEATVVGIGMAHYQFKEEFENRPSNPPNVMLSSLDVEDPENSLAWALDKVSCLNWSRHLINLPPNVASPDGIVALLMGSLPAGLKMTVWDEKKLEKENLNLLLAVGQGSVNPPCLVHLQWRPNKNQKPLCFVGKGVTFDTGGLDIKPSSGMRLMKKDMGGAAIVAGLALWVAQSRLQINCDFFIALAENAVDGNAFRPSDLIRSRAGFLVEIDNTDAEGRLVLADALNVALDQKPEAIIDVATLTGAIKVALGAEVAGLFSNNDALAADIEIASRRKGDFVWRMPLVQKYFSSLASTPFADFKNSADGFGGAITAALFLQKFVGGVPWAHLDVYAWTDRAQGALGSTGGHAQGLQMLMDFLENR